LTSYSKDKSVDQARRVLKMEAEGVLGLRDRVGPEFASAVELIYDSRGRVVVTGIGKSGLVGRKIVATLNSTGTPAVFLHPVEAMHGDLGMVLPGDVLLALSNSGETAELNALLDSVTGVGAKIVAMTGDPESTLGQCADLVLDVGVPQEACPLGLAPTTSTTAALAMGDALAVALLSRRQFNQTDFRRLHPGGNLGERLTVQVREVMVSGDRAPRIGADAALVDAVREMDRKNLGVLLIVGAEERLEGILTDGDLRRLVVGGGAVDQRPIGQVMTRTPFTIGPTRLAAEALDIMQAHEITVLPIVDQDQRLLGLINLHHLLGKGRFHFAPPGPAPRKKDVEP
jgi:arabinose-5-phosphate isomerase